MTQQMQDAVYSTNNIFTKHIYVNIYSFKHCGHALNEAFKFTLALSPNAVE